MRVSTIIRVIRFNSALIRVMKIAIINGPNLNLLGKRETDVYGKQSFEHFLVSLKKKYPYVTFCYFQS